MANIAKVLKEEISRIARKQAKADITALRRDAIAARRAISGLRKQLAALEKAQKTLAAHVPAPAVPAPSEGGESARKWVSARGVRSLRAKLRLTQAEFAQLAGVTSQAVNLWEHKKGKLRLRRTTLAALDAVRGMGVKAARARLAGDTAAPGKPVKRAAAKRKTAAKKSASRKTAAKKSAPRKAAAKKTAPRKARGKKAAAKKAAPRKARGKKAPTAATPKQ